MEHICLWDAVGEQFQKNLTMTHFALSWIVRLWTTYAPAAQALASEQLQFLIKILVLYPLHNVGLVGSNANISVRLIPYFKRVTPYRSFAPAAPSFDGHIPFSADIDIAGVL
jgi:hypothetical protein